MSTKKKAKAAKAKQVEQVLHKCPFCDACPHVKEAESKQRVVHVPVYVYPQQIERVPLWEPTITCGGTFR